MHNLEGIQAKTARNSSQAFPSLTMEVYIDKEVHEELVSFYQAALRNHEALDEATVVNKINRLYNALDTLSETAEIYPRARLNEDWISKGYREFLCEDFHFAYEVMLDKDGQIMIIDKDAVHSLLYR